MGFAYKWMAFWVKKKQDRYLVEIAILFWKRYCVLIENGLRGCKWNG